MVATGEVAAVGADEMYAIAAQDVDVALCRGVLPHFSIHRWGDADRSMTRQGKVGGGEWIRGHSVGKRAEYCGRRWCNEKKIGLIGKGDVSRLPALFFILKVD